MLQKICPPAHIEASPQVLHAAKVGLLLGRGSRVGQQARHLAVLDKHAQHGAKGGCRHEGVIACLMGIAAANLLQGQDTQNLGHDKGQRPSWMLSRGEDALSAMGQMIDTCGRLCS